jgi:lysylphosphatidylglycerol synthetase-like protein (DUF2156 family)
MRAILEFLEDDDRFMRVWTPLLVVSALVWFGTQPGFAQPLAPTQAEIPSPGGATNLEMWTYIVGVVMPLIVALITQTHWERCTQALTAVAVCVVVGVGTCYFNGALDVRDLAASILRIFIAAIAAYYGFWKPTGIAPRLQAATTIPQHDSPHTTVA